MAVSDRQTAEAIDSVLSFWFEELEPDQHWIKDPRLDEYITTRFGTVHEQAAAGTLSAWRANERGRLAEVIVLDQFSRNIYRDQAQSFACDALARDLCIEALEFQIDKALSAIERTFLYMPLMHSENLSDHERAMLLFDQPGMENNLDFERRHKVIIERFGRYPHRNEILGRDSTPEELEFLSQPGSSF